MSLEAYTLTVATPGTPQQCDAGAGLPTIQSAGVTYASGSATPRGRHVILQASPLNTAAKNIYVGGPKLNRTGPVGCCAILAPGQSISLGQGSEQVWLNDIWIDTDSSNAATEKVLVSVVG